MLVSTVERRYPIHRISYCHHCNAVPRGNPAPPSSRKRQGLLFVLCRGDRRLVRSFTKSTTIGRWSPSPPKPNSSTIPHSNNNNHMSFVDILDNSCPEATIRLKGSPQVGPLVAELQFNMPLSRPYPHMKQDKVSPPSPPPPSRRPYNHRFMIK